MLVVPEALGTGYGWINLIEFQKFSSFYSPVLPLILLLLVLPFVKILTTSLSIGSGGSGGVFAPGLFIGAFVGADVGLAFHYLFPTVAPDIAPFVIIGMMSFFGAAGKVPLSVIVMVTEMTSSLQLLPGAMIAVAISYLVSGNYTIYRSQVPTRRDSPAHKSEYEVPIMRKLRISQCKLSDVKLSDHDTVETATRVMTDNNFLSLPVVNATGKFLGIVYLHDIIRASPSEAVSKYIVRGSPYVTLSSTLEYAWEIMAVSKSRWVAVVENGEFMGIATMESMVQAYENEMRALAKQS